MRQRLDGHVDAALLEEADEGQAAGAALVDDVDARAGPLGERAGPVQRLDRHHVGARGEMGQRIVAAGLLQALLAPEEDRRVLGVNGASQAELGEDLEAFEHRAVIGAGQVAGGVAEEELEADDAGLNQRFEVTEIVLAEKPVDTEVDDRLGGRRLALHLEMCDRSVAGTVLGISKTVVTPPTAAAALPVSQSSL